MSVRKLKPITPGQRFRVVNSFDAITTARLVRVACLYGKQCDRGRDL